MAETFMTNQLEMNAESMMKLERLHNKMFAKLSILQRSLQFNCSLSNQKELDAYPRAIKQIEFYGILDTNSHMCTRILQRNRKIVATTFKWLNTTQ